MERKGHSLSEDLYGLMLLLQPLNFITKIDIGCLYVPVQASLGEGSHGCTTTGRGTKAFAILTLGTVFPLAVCLSHNKGLCYTDTPDSFSICLSWQY